jgi:hypothetical protein
MSVILSAMYSRSLIGSDTNVASPYAMSPAAIWTVRWVSGVTPQFLPCRSRDVVDAVVPAVPRYLQISRSPWLLMPIGDCAGGWLHAGLISCGQRGNQQRQGVHGSALVPSLSGHIALRHYRVALHAAAYHKPILSLTSDSSRACHTACTGPIVRTDFTSISSITMVLTTS